MGSTLELRCVACVILTQGLVLRYVRYVRCVKFYARPLRCIRCVVKETAPNVHSKMCNCWHVLSQQTRHLSSTNVIVLHYRHATNTTAGFTESTVPVGLLPALWNMLMVVFSCHVKSSCTLYPTQCSEHDDDDDCRRGSWWMSYRECLMRRTSMHSDVMTSTSRWRTHTDGMWEMYSTFPNV